MYIQPVNKMDNIKKILFIILYFGGRFSLSNLLFKYLLVSVFVKNQVKIELLYENFPLIFLLFLSLCYWPSTKYPTYFISPSKRIEEEMKRLNDLKERELEIHKVGQDAFKKLFSDQTESEK